MVTALQSLAAQPWVERLGWTLLHFLWQGATIALLYAFARWRIGESRGGQLRYLIACTALAAMLAAPVVTFELRGQPAPFPANRYIGTVPVTSPPTAIDHSSTVPVQMLVIQVWQDRALPWLVMAWLTGAVVFWVRLFGGWMIAVRLRSRLVRVSPPEWQRKLDQLSARLCVSRPVRLLVSALVETPTVVGWLRPLVLMPLGALAGLPSEHVEALLAHELAHIRRYDYLVNILQSLAESLLFYHPAIWWISGHIRDEREVCCDEIAVSVTGDALSYACALAGLEVHRPHRSRRRTDMHPALAANGGSLADRIARLLGVQRSGPAPASGPGLAAAGALIAIAAIAAFAQPSAPRLVFEVASIKPTPPEYVGFQSYVKGDRYTAMTASLRNLVGFAYGILDFQIAGGPAWSSSALYNIDAKIGTGKPDPNGAQARLMLQSLLADRFNLKFHRVTKKRPGYAIFIDKDGPKLVVSTNPRDLIGPGRGNIRGLGVSVRPLARELSSQLESPIEDRTGLTAAYNFTLTWTPDIQASEAPGPSLFTAIRDQLGLRLESVKDVPVDFLIIDNAQRPSEN